MEGNRASTGNTRDTTWGEERHVKLCTYWLAEVDIFDLSMLTSRRSWLLMCCNRSSSAILLGWKGGGWAERGKEREK